MPRPPPAQLRPCSSALPLSASNRCMAAGGRLTGTVPPTAASMRPVGHDDQEAAAQIERQMGLVAQPLVGDHGGRQALRVADQDPVRPDAELERRRPRPVVPPARRPAGCGTPAWPAGIAPPASSSRPGASRTSTMFIGGSPMKLATNRLAGCSFSAAGGAYCCSTPCSMTAIRSASAIASVWSWVTNTVVILCSIR